MRILALLCVVALATACTGPTGSSSRSPDYNTRKAPEPTTSGIRISGEATFGVSVVK